MESSFVVSQNELEVRRTGTRASVPHNPKAKLMYYLKCVATVLEIENVSDYTDYSNYRYLSEEDTDMMLELVALFSPDELVGKVFFENDELCGDSANEFFELESVDEFLAVTDSVFIGGTERTVAKIMTFQSGWLWENYLKPMAYFANRLSRLARGLPGHKKSRKCIIL